VALQAQSVATLQYTWSTGVAEFATPGLTIADSSGYAPTVVGSVASGLGVTVDYNGDQRISHLKVTVDHTAWIEAGLVQSLTLASIPAKARILSVIADTTAALTNGVSTLDLEVGITGTLGGCIATHDVQAAPVTKGLLDADMGTLMTRAAAIQGGTLPSWTAATDLIATLTSGTINLGDGVATALTTGSTTFYVTIEML
jgi:hypothetical protein